MEETLSPSPGLMVSTSVTAMPAIDHSRDISFSRSLQQLKLDAPIAGSPTQLSPVLAEADRIRDDFHHANFASSSQAVHRASIYLDEISHPERPKLPYETGGISSEDQRLVEFKALRGEILDFIAQKELRKVSHVIFLRDVCLFVCCICIDDCATMLMMIGFELIPIL